MRKPKPAAPAKSGSSAPPNLNIKSIAVTDSTIRFAKSEKSGAKLLAELASVKVTVANIANGQTGKLTLGTDLNFEQTAGGTNGVDALAAKLASTLDFTLKPDLLPQGFKGGLRLDLRDSAIKPAKSGATAIVPGKPSASALVKRLETKDAGELMPPPNSHKKLSAAQKDVLKRWIAAGAKYEAHWAFVPLSPSNQYSVSSNQSPVKGASGQTKPLKTENWSLNTSPISVEF